MQPTCTPRAGPYAISVQSWAFPGPPWAINFGVPAHYASRRPSSSPASTQQILQHRDQGLTWNEVARQVDMTVSGVWSRYRRARPPKRPRLGRWQQVLADALDQNLAIGVRASAWSSRCSRAERGLGH